MRKICAIPTVLSWWLAIKLFSFFFFVMINKWFSVDKYFRYKLFCLSLSWYLLLCNEGFSLLEVNNPFFWVTFFFFTVSDYIGNTSFRNTETFLIVWRPQGVLGRWKWDILAYGLTQKTSSGFKGQWSFLHKNLYEFSKPLLAVEEWYAAVSLANFGNKSVLKMRSEN